MSIRKTELRLSKRMFEFVFNTFISEKVHLLKVSWDKIKRKFLNNKSTAIGRSENPGVPVLFGGLNLPPLVEIGWTDLPKCVQHTQWLVLTVKMT